MSTRAPSILSAALGQIRYRLALAVIGFGVFVGALLACIIPLCVYASYFDTGGALSETLRWAITGSILFITVGSTYGCRGWIVRKALVDVPPEPVRIWTGRDVVGAGLALTHLALGLAGSIIALIVVALLAYGGYLLITMLSVPVAILIGAIIIALAILFAAFA